MRLKLLLCGALVVSCTAAQAQSPACTVYPNSGPSYELYYVKNCIDAQLQATELSRLLRRPPWSVIMHVPVTHSQFKKVWDENQRKSGKR